MRKLKPPLDSKARALAAQWVKQSLDGSLPWHVRNIGDAPTTPADAAKYALHTLTVRKVRRLVRHLPKLLRLLEPVRRGRPKAKR